MLWISLALKLLEHTYRIAIYLVLISNVYNGVYQSLICIHNAYNYNSDIGISVMCLAHQSVHYMHVTFNSVHYRYT